ncbi:hypothetical protein OIU76_021952 [Salix suchowensis]|nr:hypothetical protein OIU76_021952 [Salix suchowensis]
MPHRSPSLPLVSLSSLPHRSPSLPLVSLISHLCLLSPSLLPS